MAVASAITAKVSTGQVLSDPKDDLEIKKFPEENVITSSNIVSDSDQNGSSILYGSEWKSSGTVTTIDANMKCQSFFQYIPRLKFLINCLAFTIGFSNTGTCPLIILQNGGWAYIVIYLVLMFALGLPVMFLELIIGRCGHWSCSRYLKVVLPPFSTTGIIMFLAAWLNSICYMITIAYYCVYLFQSFTDYQAWGDAEDTTGNAYFKKNILMEDEKTAAEVSWYYLGPINVTLMCLAACLWFLTVMMMALKQDTHTVVIGWIIGIALILLWIVFVFFFSQREGASSYSFLSEMTNWGKLLEPSTWRIAISHIVVTMGFSLGGFHLLGRQREGSLSSFHFDGIVLLVLNILVSVEFLEVFYASAENVAIRHNITMAKVLDENVYNAHRILPMGATNMRGGQFISIVFYITLILFGLGYQFTVVELIIDTISDYCPWIPHLPLGSIHLYSLNAIFSFILNLPLITGFGYQLQQFIDQEVYAIIVLLILFFQMMAFSWYFGAEQILENIKELGINLAKFSKWYYWITWKFLIPLTSACVAESWSYLLWTRIFWTCCSYFDYAIATSQTFLEKDSGQTWNV